MALICGVEERAAVQMEMSLWLRLPKTSNHYVLILKVETAMFAETLDNSQHSTRLIPEGRIVCTIHFIAVRGDTGVLQLHVK
jgi:hypothetical protein